MPVIVIQCPIMCLSLATLEGKGVQIYINQPGWKTNILNHTLTFSSLPAFKISGRLCFCHIGYSTDGCLILPNNSNFDFLFFLEFYLFTPTYPIVAYCYWLKRCFYIEYAKPKHHCWFMNTDCRLCYLKFLLMVDLCLNILPYWYILEIWNQ